MKKYFYFLLLIVHCSLSIAFAQDSTKVLFIGDSHTEGSGHAAWRFPLLDTLSVLGYVISPLGNRVTNHTTAYTYTHIGSESWYHQGITGITASTYSGVIGDTIRVNITGRANNIPSIATLMLGTNDVANGSFSTATIRNNIKKIIDTVTTISDTTWMIVANVLPLCKGGLAVNPARADSIAALNILIQQLVADEVTAGKHCLFVNIHDAVDTTTDFQSDGIHLTETANHIKIMPTLLPYVVSALDTVLATPRKFLLWHKP